VYLEAGQNNISEDDYANSRVNATLASIPINTQSNPTDAQNNINNNDSNNTTTPAPGQSNPYYEIVYPTALNNFSNEQLSGAINKLISEKEKEKNSTSPFSGLGSSFIEGGKASNINPFLAIAHLSVENNFAMNNDNPKAWHLIPGSNNAFGRTATSQQPHVLSSGGRLVYAWSSWQDSLSGEDSWFVYTRRKIDNGSWPGNLRDYIYAYAPPVENNTEQYFSDVKNMINKLAGYAGDENIESYADYSSSGGLGDCNSSGSGGTVVQIAEAEVGRKEEGSSNCGDEIEKYFSETNQSCGIPWCAVFVNWVFKEAGQPIGGGALAKGVGQWFEDNKFFFSWKEQFRPQPGDIFVKGRGSSGAQLDGGIGHIGIVVAVNGYQISTVEGNSSNSVSKRTYQDYRAIPSLVGFGRYVDASTVQPENDFNPLTDAPTEQDSGVTED
ncbi:MAG TPA: CHAP domain-containing protein, partial [Candidatus Saccharimonadales bacterium]|nr:CHAP domain-containing protein [Candidatus Saccharimonadales bacterium]